MKLKRRALVVEDRPELWKEYLDRLFPISDWEISHYATTVAEAKKQFQADSDLDLLVIDYELPDGTGRDFLEFARSIDPNIPIFLFSEVAKGFSAEDASDFNALPFFLSKTKIRDNVEAISGKCLRVYEQYMAEMCSPSVTTEFGRLRTVLVHEPWYEVRRLDPSDLPYYLIESPPDLNQASEQHKGFITKLKEEADRPITLEVALLLREILDRQHGVDRTTIIENILLSHDFRTVRARFGDVTAFSPPFASMMDKLTNLPSDALTQTLLCGLNRSDFSGVKDAAGQTNHSYQVVEPVPNLYFMRDPCFVLGNSLVLSRMYWPIRRREPRILREIIKHHPFMENVRHNLVDWDNETGPVSAEGGDAMAIAPGTYAIALSERTSRQAVSEIAQQLLRNGAKEVIQPTIPVKRAFIHLDTVCSLAGPEYVLVHPEAIHSYTETYRWTSESEEPKPIDKSFVQYLQEEHGKKPIETGNPLEQFDDAANVLMVNPSTAMTYDRNPVTNDRLQGAGVNVVQFHGSDLVVGRGGARCMTMPLRRD
jgi:arginine deiminase